MWSAFKKIPLIPKIFVILLVVLAIVRVSHIYSGEDRSPAYTAYIRENNARRATEEADTTNASSSRVVRTASAVEGETIAQPQSNAAASNQLLGQFKAQQVQLQSRMMQCQQEMNHAAARMAMDAANGRMPIPAQCEQYMNTWIAQEAVVEAQIYRLQTGDSTSSMSGITGYQAPASTPSRSSSGAGGGSGSGRDPVADWDRGHMRETSMYTDESGEEHELPTANYYFRNRATGQMVSSELSDPPNDGHDYERYTSRPQ